MRSTASIKSHPLHPMLIAFPIAFLSGTFIFDVLSEFLNRKVLWELATHLELAGVIAAVVAAVPGIIDYQKTVPPKSSAKKRATKHGLLNTTHVLIFFAAWWCRQDAEFSRLTIILMEAAGVGILAYAGWLGGTLVYRNQIGVDARYAHSGKWKESYFEDNRPVYVADADELKVNQMKLLHIGNKRIVLGRTENGYVAFDDHCTHKGGSLAGGSMICGTVQCPWHGSQFNVSTGEVTAGPATGKIGTYKVSEIDGMIYLES